MSTALDDGAPAAVARLLSVPTQSPTLVHTFILHDRGGTPVEWVRIHVDPDQPTPIETLSGVWQPRR